MSMITKCSKCNADIMFVRMASGKSMPVNLPAVRMIVKDPDDNVYAITDCYTTHFNTCPFSDRFRKKE